MCICRYVFLKRVLNICKKFKESNETCLKRQTCTLYQYRYLSGKFQAIIHINLVTVVTEIEAKLSFSSGTQRALLFPKDQAWWNQAFPWGRLRKCFPSLPVWRWKHPMQCPAGTGASNPLGYLHSSTEKILFNPIFFKLISRPYCRCSITQQSSQLLMSVAY